MDDPITEIGGSARPLPVTSHTALAAIRDGDPARRDAELEKLIEIYWKPVYGLVRRTWAASNEDAKDLTQDFFTSVVLQDSFAERYSKAKGSFRGYLKGALRNFLSKHSRDAGREKRGGHVVIRSLTLPDGSLDGLVPDLHQMRPDEVFDSTWRRVVLDRASRDLEQKLAAQGKQKYFEVFRRYDLDPEDGSVSYETLARELKISADDVKNYLTRAREEFRNSVRALLCQSVGTPEALAEEWDALFGGA